MNFFIFCSNKPTSPICTFGWLFKISISKMSGGNLKQPPTLKCESDISTPPVHEEEEGSYSRALQMGSKNDNFLHTQQHFCNFSPSICYPKRLLRLPARALYSLRVLGYSQRFKGTSSEPGGYLQRIWRVSAACCLGSEASGVYVDTGLTVGITTCGFFSVDSSLVPQLPTRPTSGKGKLKSYLMRTQTNLHPLSATQSLSHPLSAARCTNSTRVTRQELASSTLSIPELTTQAYVHLGIPKLDHSPASHITRNTTHPSPVTAIFLYPPNSRYPFIQNDYLYFHN